MTEFEKQAYDRDLTLALQNKGELRVLSNNDVEHARILVRRLIQAAKSEIVILCHRLSWLVYGCDEVAQALRKAFEKNPKLKCEIYIRNDVPDYSSFLAVLLTHNVHIQKRTTVELSDVIIVDQENGREETNAEKKEGKAHIYDRGWAKAKLQELRTQLKTQCSNASRACLYIQTGHRQCEWRCVPVLCLQLCMGAICRTGFPPFLDSVQSDICSADGEELLMLENQVSGSCGNRG